MEDYWSPGTGGDPLIPRAECSHSLALPITPREWRRRYRVVKEHTDREAVTGEAGCTPTGDEAAGSGGHGDRRDMSVYLGLQ